MNRGTRIHWQDLGLHANARSQCAACVAPPRFRLRKDGVCRILVHLNDDVVRLRYADTELIPLSLAAAIGVQGLAPYFFNFEPTFYIRDVGRIAGTIQGSYDLYITQSLILQPQAELNFYSQADPARGIGSGFSDLDSGLRVGYQISRKFAPYVGYTYSGVSGETTKFSGVAGEPTSASRIVFGIWLWH